MHRIAVIGSGIAGLAAASRLAAAPGGPAVTLLEAGGHFGGHAAPQVQLPAAEADLGAVLAADHGAAREVEVARHASPRGLAAHANGREQLGALDLEGRAEIA